MVVRTTRLGGTDWIDGEVLYAADLDQTITRAANEPWYQFIAYDIAITAGLLKFSSTRFQSMARTSTDAGLTWSGSGFGANYVSSSFGAYGIAIINNSNTSVYTTDSGATWNAATTAPAGMTLCRDNWLYNATVGIAVGDAGAGQSAFYTTDGGNHWTVSASGSTAQLNACCMCSATVGYYVTSAKDIYKTTDGGVNWTDTTINHSLGTEVYLYPMSTDKILIVDKVSVTFQTYIDSTGVVTSYRLPGTATVNSNIVKATNGKYYWIYEDTNTMLNLVKFNGTSWYLKPLFQATSAGGTTYRVSNLIEVSDILYFNSMAFNIVKISVENE